MPAATPGAAQSGYVVDVQAESLSHLATRIVLPLLAQTGAPPPIRDLNLVIDIDGTPHVLLTQSISAMPLRELKRAVASLSIDRDRVTRALDTLLIGF